MLLHQQKKLNWKILKYLKENICGEVVSSGITDPQIETA